MKTSFAGTPRRRTALAAGAMALAMPGIARADRFPDRPIRLIVPWSPGGSADSQLRSLADIASRQFGQPVVVENRSGGRATLGALQMLQSRPDGHNLSQFHLSILRQPYMTRAPRWDCLKDFTYIIGLTGWLFGVAVRADSPIRTWADYLAHARANPDRLGYTTSGIATTNHIAMEELAQREGIKLLHVPFRGNAEGVSAVLSGQVDSIADASAWAPFVENGQLRLLNVWSAERSARFPDVPTLKELGYDMVVTSPYGLHGPAGMAPEVVRRLHDVFREALLDPANVAVRGMWDMPDGYMSTDDYTAFIHRRAAYEKAMVTRLDLRLD